MKFRFFTTLITLFFLLSMAACQRRMPNETQQLPEQTTEENSTIQKEPVHSPDDSLSSYSVTTDEPSDNTSDNSSNNHSDSAEKITTEEAIQIAIAHAGLTQDQVSQVHAELDFDDGIYKYEVQFHQDRIEYDYDIDALTGTVLSLDKDMD